jgi:hypothetical protein
MRGKAWGLLKKLHLPAKQPKFGGYKMPGKSRKSFVGSFQQTRLFSSTDLAKRSAPTILPL